MTEEKKEQMNAFVAALSALKHDARSKGFKKGSGGQSSMACPSCKTGTVKYSVASVNGHMWAACSTAGCVRFME